MTGILQVERGTLNDHLYDLIEELENTAKLLRLVRLADTPSVLDWELLRNGVDSRFNVVFDDLMLDEDGEELDLIEGEETDVDDTLHPLDPDNEFYEGFDDV